MGVDIYEIDTSSDEFEDHGAISHYFEHCNKNANIILRFSMEVSKDKLGDPIDFLIQVTDLQNNDVVWSLADVWATEADDQGGYIIWYTVRFSKIFKNHGHHWYKLRVYTHEDGPHPNSAEWIFYLGQYADW